MTETRKQPYQKPVVRKISFSVTDKNTRSYQRIMASGEFEGHAVKKLTARYGSPLFVLSEAVLRERYQDMMRAFASHYPATSIAYSYKTNYLSAVCAILHQEGALAEVVSPLEYEMAKRLNMPGQQIVFNGPYKRPEDLRRAFEEGARVNIDSPDELATAAKVAESMGRTVRVGIRVNMKLNYPAWDKFGFSLEEGAAYEAGKRISQHPFLELAGLHCHVGTFVIDLSVYRRLSENLTRLALQLQEDFGAVIDTLDFGGGYASRNTLHTQVMPGEVIQPTPDQYAEAITEPLKKKLREFKTPPRVILEPGRALVDEAMVLLASIVSVKTNATGKFLILDAGVNLLPTSYWYKHELAVDQELSHMTEEVDIFGPLCMQVDVIRRGVMLPFVQVGDIITIRNVGAYNLSQSMQFIFARPAVVLVSGERIELIRRAEVYEDVKGPESVPERLLARPQPASG